MRQITTKHDIHWLGACLKTPGRSAAKDIGRGPGVAGFSLNLLLCALCALLRLIARPDWSVASGAIYVSLLLCCLISGFQFVSLSAFWFSVLGLGIAEISPMRFS